MKHNISSATPVLSQIIYTITAEVEANQHAMYNIH